MTLRLKRPGFTVVDMLVVIGVMSILTALLLPAVQSVRDGKAVQCQNNLHQIGVALHSYEADYRCYPVCNTNVAIRTKVPTLTLVTYWGEFAVHPRLLPYLELHPLYDAINLRVRHNSHGRVCRGTVTRSPFPRRCQRDCPDDTSGDLSLSFRRRSLHATGTNYRANVGSWTSQ